ncbi:MAG: sulfatase [Bryobacterales bacterium]|jgi:arylsulfatase A-like enzyme|nr:sulfatase [Bryobacterales bacterium]
MDRRQFLQTSASVSAASAVGTLAQAQAPQTRDTPGDRRPNLIWLFSDQHRSQAMGCTGDPNAYTPTIDTCAVFGSHFVNAVSGFPLCCPFRGSVLTSRYPHKCVPGHEYPLPDGQPTLAQPFQQAGYHTAYIGKWHLAGYKERNGRAAMHITDPNKRGGFDHWVGYENNNSQWDSWVHGGEGKDAFHYRLPGYETDELTNLLIRYIRDRSEARKNGDDKPFFAILSVQPPHDPYVAPEEYMQRYTPAKIELRANVPRGGRAEEIARRDLAGYYAMIANWDHNIARVQKALQDVEMAFNTHLIIMSDHGDMHGSHGEFRKTSPWEESIRVPFIITGAQHRYDGYLNNRPTAPLNYVDIAPTSLGLCGIEKPDWMEGHDYSHYRLQSRQAARKAEPESAFLQCVIPTGHGNSINKPWRGLVTKDGWKIACFEGLVWQMFNLNEDPYELTNLAHNNTVTAERRKLLGQLQQWVSDTGDRFTIPEQ